MKIHKIDKKVSKSLRNKKRQKNDIKDIKNN